MRAIAGAAHTSNVSRPRPKEPVITAQSGRGQEAVMPADGLLVLLLLGGVIRVVVAVVAPPRESLV